MSRAVYRVGDVFERMAEIPDGSVDLILTSPPFLALRSYLPSDHPDKGKEIGSEPTPAAFLDTLLHLSAEWRRVLAPHGSIAVELGDTYSGSGGAGGDYAEGGLRDGQPGFVGSARAAVDRPQDHDGSMKFDRIPSDGRPPIRNMNGKVQGGGNGWPLAKSLAGIPHLYHLSLAYGRNLLTGEPSPAGEWRIRNVVAWCRPNPPVGALGDKFRPATSFMTIACVSARRYFDLDAVREANARVSETPGVAPGRAFGKPGAGGDSDRLGKPMVQNPAGAPPLDWWEIPTAPYAGSHYATWPPALCKRPIEAMVPHRVCLTCGKPSERIVDVTRVAEKDDRQRRVKASEYRMNGTDHPPEIGWEMDRQTVGWSDCGHDAWRAGIVLDPFAGSGTTLAVATGCGRDAIGIDLDARNAELARERVGLFLTVEDSWPATA